MGNEVQLYSVPDLQQMAQAMASTGLFGFKKKEEAFALMLIAQAEGKHPATIAQDYDIIQNRPALKSVAALSRFQHAGGSVEWIESNSERAVAEFTHKLGGTLRVTWDIDRAKLAQLAGKENWKKYPDQMLRARCAAEGVRAVFPACLNGMYVSEEVQDMEPRKSAKLDPSKEVGSEPPPVVPPPPPEPTRLEKIYARYLAKCASARETLGRDLPAVYEPGPEWTEADYTTAARDLDEVLEAEREPPAGDPVD